jgi:hypothetical protein
MSEKKLVLFYVHSNPNRKVEGEFGSKVAAKKFRDRHNANLKPGDIPWFVGIGHDHWRWKTDLSVPQRHIIADPQMPEELPMAA